jgi:8-oxo-dGTP diphosphatase
MTQKSIRVVAAVVQQSDKYLITQRRENAAMPLLWEFPGGA